MASRADVEAGKAHILLYMKNNATAQLNKFAGGLRSVGNRIVGVGAMLGGLGATIIGPLTAAIAHFNSSGDALGKMAARTGIGAGALAEFGFAAEQSGASLEDVEKGVRKMQRTILDAKTGMKSAQEALAMLGLSAARLQGQKPEYQFQAIADALAKVDDPSRRAALAMEVLGKSGTQLLPMVEGLRELREEARALGLVPTDEAVKGAEELNDALNRVRRIGMAMAFEIGAALQPVLMPALNTIKTIAVTVAKWVRENAALVRTVAMVGAGILAAGAAVTAIGLGFLGAAAVVSGLASAISFLLSPVTLVTAAIVGGVTAWAMFTESGKAAVAAITNFFLPMVETIKTSIGGISDALMSGDLMLAGQIAVKGLQLVFQQGLDKITAKIGGTLGDAIGSIGTDLIRGDFAGAWETAVAGMAAIWDSFVAGVVEVFTAGAKAVVDTWQQAVSFISDKILEIAALSPTISKTLLGVEVRPQDLAQTKGFAREGIAGQAGDIKSVLDRVNDAALARERKSSQDFGSRISGGSGDAAKRLQDELDELRRQAAEARAAAASATNAPGGAAVKGVVSAGIASKGTFSAAALLALGQGGGTPQERTAKAAEKTAERVDRLVKINEATLEEAKAARLAVLV